MDEAGALEDRAVAEVLIPVAVDQTYSYALPPGLQLLAGDFVEVPLGARKAFGVVWALSAGAGGNLKKIERRLDFPPLPAKLRGFLDWVASWTLAPTGHGVAHGRACRARSRRRAGPHRPARHRRRAEAPHRGARAGSWRRCRKTWR